MNKFNIFIIDLFEMGFGYMVSMFFIPAVMGSNLIFAIVAIIFTMLALYIVVAMHNEVKELESYDFVLVPLSIFIGAIPGAFTSLETIYVILLIILSKGLKIFIK